MNKAKDSEINLTLNFLRAIISFSISLQLSFDAPSIYLRSSMNVKYERYDIWRSQFNAFHLPFCNFCSPSKHVLNIWKKKIYKYHVQRKWWEQSRDNFKFCAIKDDMQNLTPTGRMMVYLNKPMSQQLLNVKWSVEVSVNNYNWTDLKTEFFRLVLVVVLYSMIFISFWIVVINQLFVNK